jgi:hypothetical protein
VFCELLATALREDVRAVFAIGADEPAHIFDDPQNVEVRFSAKCKLATNVSHRDGLFKKYMIF